MRKGILAGHGQAVCMAAFSPDGKRIVSSSRGGTVRGWHMEDHTCRAVLQNVPGIAMHGCDLRKAHAELTPGRRSIPADHGAIL